MSTEANERNTNLCVVPTSVHQRCVLVGGRSSTHSGVETVPRDRSFSPHPPFKRLAIPLPKRGPNFVGALEKRQQRLLR